MLRNYKTPHKIIHWQDNYSEAKGWIVIQNIVNGISGGGLFMSTHATLEEVKDLAYTMCLKNTLQEIPIGGGKGGIRFDHNHSEALNVVSRFLKDNEDIIKNDWCTGGDLNTTTSMITKILKEATGLSSPFSCLLNMLQKRLNIQPNLEKFHRCLHFPLNSYWKVEDLITGYSIIETIIAILERQGKKIQRHNVVIQGFGKVGKAASCFIKDYFNIVGICEKDWFLYDNKGIDVDQLMIDQHVKTFSSKFKVIYRNTSEGSEDFLIRFLQNVEADIFAHVPSVMLLLNLF